MGNTISNATEATNPTYDLNLQGGMIILVEKSDAEYDFQELKYKSIDEAEKALSKRIDQAVKTRMEQVNEISKEIQAKNEQIRDYVENIATLNRQTTIKDIKFQRVAKGKAYQIVC